jgi:hypothetical protein
MFEHMESNVIHQSPSWRVTNAIQLKDGSTLSIQASETHYCTPRETKPYHAYTHFEVWIDGEDEPRVYVSLKELGELIEAGGGYVI